MSLNGAYPSKSKAAGGNSKVAASVRFDGANSSSQVKSESRTAPSTSGPVASAVRRDVDLDDLLAGSMFGSVVDRSQAVGNPTPDSKALPDNILRCF